MLKAGTEGPVTRLEHVCQGQEIRASSPLFNYTFSRESGKFASVSEAF